MSDSQIWLVGQGTMSRNAENKYEERLFSVTLKNVNWHAAFNPELNMSTMLLSREDLIKLRDAIDKEIPRC